MKAGIAAGLYAAEALRRAGIALPGTVELSGTVDEESGGFAGVAWLCEKGRIGKAVTDYVIIPEPLNVDRICLGHRGVYWFDVTTKRPDRPRQHAVPGEKRRRVHGRSARSRAHRAQAGPGPAPHRGARDARRGSAGHDQRERDRGRPDRERNAEPMRGGPMPRDLRPALPRSRRGSRPPRPRSWPSSRSWPAAFRASLRAQGPDGRPSFGGAAPIRPW